MFKGILHPVSFSCFCALSKKLKLSKPQIFSANYAGIVTLSIGGTVIDVPLWVLDMDVKVWSRVEVLFFFLPITF